MAADVPAAVVCGSCDAGLPMSCRCPEITAEDEALIEALLDTLAFDACDDLPEISNARWLWDSPEALDTVFRLRDARRDTARRR